MGKQEERRLNPIKHLGGQQGQSVADALFDFILAKIAQGAWPVGHSLPGEKDLKQIIVWKVLASAVLSSESGD